MKRALQGAIAPVAACLIALATGYAAAQTTTDHLGGGARWINKSDIAVIGSSPKVTKVTASGAAQTVVIPAYGSAVYDITLTHDCTITVTASHATTGTYGSIKLILRNPSGAFVTTLPGTLKWSNGSALTIATTAGTVTEITLSTPDAGTTVIAR